MQKLNLPQPDPNAQAACAELITLIRQEIDVHQGWIPFARYMDLALYAPRFGYYTGGSAKLGGHGDFITAPEISSLFGGAIAQFASQILSQTANRIMEFGAGTGKLAADILTELHQLGCAPERYYIVDLSGELRERQQDRLKDFKEVVWLSELPEQFSGLVIGNEVLDAMPVDLIKKTTNGWMSLGVGWDGEAFCWSERALQDQQVLQQIPNPEQLMDGYLTEIHITAGQFMHSISAILNHGNKAAALWIDYGFPNAEYYLPQRHQGTLMCHYRHHAHPDPFYWPGLQDITAHIDFSEMARNSEQAGLQPLCYTSQAQFLIACGITDLLQRLSPSDPMTYLPQIQGLQKLMSPAEMGELFKVLVVGKNVELSEQFQKFDRQIRLNLKTAQE